MAFKKVPGLPGKVYQPIKKDSDESKHSCQDCFSCQKCSDDRCSLCLDTEIDTQEINLSRPDSVTEESE